MSRDQKREVWRAHIKAHHEGGLSQRAYCAEHGLSKSQFSYWKSQLARTVGKGHFVPLPIQAHTDTVSLDLPGGIRMAMPVTSVERLLPTILRCVAREAG